MISIYLKGFSLDDKLRINKDAAECGLKVEGHSGLGIKGTDIVCSAVSAIVQTAVASITSVAGIRQRIDQRDGYLETAIPLEGIDAEKLKALNIILDMMIVGLRLVDENYPKSLMINIE